MDLVKGEVDFYDKEYILDFLESRREQLTGVAITGGDPLVHGEAIPPFFFSIKQLGYKIKLDHNGSNPELLEELLSMGLIDAIAVDIKAPWNKYDQVAGVNVNKSKIKKSISLLDRSDISVTYRTTLIPSLSEKDVEEIIVSIIGECNRYVLQKFKEPERGMENVDGEGLNPEEIVEGFREKFPELNIDTRD